MDCSFGSSCKGFLPCPAVRIILRDQEFQAMIDTGLVRASLIPAEIGQLTSLIRLTCMHGERQVYLQCRLYLTVFRKMWELPIGLVPQLPCPIILGWDWPGCKDILHKVTENLETLCLWKKRGEGMARRTDNENEEPEELDLEQLVRQG